MPEPVEHRLALVLNGGISLAVWMGGVVQEIDDLRRASNGFEDASSSAAERRLLELWKQAAEERGETISVDVIGGTSAGGLNGVFLAAAVARGATMEALRNIWLTDAQLSPAALLRPQRPTSASLLNGDFFLEAIATSLDAIGPGSKADARPVSLTTTASAFDGLPRMIVDSIGAEFAQPDHRRRYRFEETRKRVHFHGGEPGVPLFEEVDGHHDFLLGDSDVRESLSRAARATASIPGVFAPVEETDSLRDRRVWPTWPTAMPGDRRHEWLLDGGLLDNSPFTPVLELISKRSVSSAWHRTLCYIVPDAALPEPVAAPPTKAAAPPPWDLAVERLQSFPGEVGFRDDMDRLGGLIRSGRSSEDADRFQRLIADPAKEVDGSSGLASVGTALLPLYRRSRASAGLLEVIDVINGGSDSGLMAPTQLLEIDRVASSPHAWLPVALPETDADLGTPWLWGLAAADRLVRLLLHVVRLSGGTTEERIAISDALHKLAAVRVAVEGRLDEDAPAHPWRTTDAGAVAALKDGVYKALDVPAALGDLVRTAATAFAGTLSRPTTALEVVRAALSLEIVDGAPGLPVHPEPSPIIDFFRFGIGDIPAFLAPSQSSIPASSADRSILYGTRLAHFAAFGRPEWRQWDWMWGRIHGATHLGQLLGLTEAQLREIIEQIIVTEGSTADAVRSRIPAMLTAESPTDLLDTLRADGRLAESADALFALLGTPSPTDPAIQPLVATSGSILTAAFGRGTRVTRGHPVVRLIATIPRWLVWRRLGRGRIRSRR